MQKPIVFFIVGVLVGMSLVGVAWAAAGLVLVNGSGVEIGTDANPLIVEVI